MALLDSFYGETPQYLSGLLGADELSRLQEQARGQSNLGMATALLRAGGPSRTPTSSALAIAEGLQSGQDIYKKALNQGLQEKMVAMQLGEQARKMQEAEAVRRFLPNLMTQGAPEQSWSGNPQQIADYFAVKGQAQIPMQAGETTINKDALMKLAVASPETFARYKALLPEYKFDSGMAYEVSPFGGVKQVGGQDKNLQLTGEESNIALRLFGTNNAAELAKIPNSSQAIEQAALAFKRASANNMTLKMPSETQLIAAGFADRMASAQNIVSDLEPKAKVGNVEAVTSYLPLIGKSIPQVIPSNIGGLSDERRQYLQAANNWIRANLRKESGAAIGTDEWSAEYQNYFPQPGDDKETIAQKAVFREIATKNMARAAGQQYTPSLPKSASTETKDLYKKFGLTPR